MQGRYSCGRTGAESIPMTGSHTIRACQVPGTQARWQLLRIPPPQALLLHLETDLTGRAQALQVKKMKGSMVVQSTGAMKTPKCQKLIPTPQPSTGDWDQYVGEQQGALQEDSAGDWAAWAADQLGLSQLVDAPQPTQLDSQVKTYLFQ